MQTKPVDIEARVGQFEAELEAQTHPINFFVRQMRDTDDSNLQYLLAERLPRLGTSSIPALNHVISDETAPKSARYLASLVALHLGDRGACVDVLLHAVQADDEPIAAANALASARITRAAPVAADLLERTDPRDSTAIFNVSKALKDLGGHPSKLACERVAHYRADRVGRAFEDDHR